MIGPQPKYAARVRRRLDGVAQRRNLLRACETPPPAVNLPAHEIATPSYGKPSQLPHGMRPSFYHLLRSPDYGPRQRYSPSLFLAQLSIV